MDFCLLCVFKYWEAGQNIIILAIRALDLFHTLNI